MDYQLIRQKRKTLTLCIKNSQLIIKAPLNLDIKYINEWLDSKIHWINQRRQIQIKQLEYQQKYVAQYYIGGYIPYMGSKIQLQLNQDLAKDYIFDGNILYLSQKLCNIKHIKNWYKQQANILYTQLLNYWQHKMQVKMKNFKLTYGLKKLGYCTNTGLIALSWQLILQPLNIIEYVVIHELAHLKYFNHNSSFWHLVEQFCPTYKQAQQHLTQHGLIYV